MKIKKIIVPFVLIVFFGFTFNFIECNVKKFDLRFYTGKDNGLSSHHDVLLLTVFFIYLNLFKKKILTFVLCFFYNIFLFLGIIFFVGIQDVPSFIIVHFVFSLLPIIIAFVLKKNKYLKLEFKFVDLLDILLYMFFLELLLRYNMKSSLLELLTQLFEESISCQFGLPQFSEE